VTFIYNVVLTLHFLGMALLIGGFFAQMGSTPRVISHWMRDGALTQLVSGLALAGMSSALVGTDEKFAPAPVGTKLAIALVITVVVLFGMRQPEGEQKSYWAAAGGLALLNVIVAVFWLATSATTG
jgi:hypothetical protein